MARLFSVEFDFLDNTYSAMVLMKDGSDGEAYEVSFYHEDLLNIIPSGKLNWEGKNGYEHINHSDGKTKELVRQLGICVEEHVTKK